MGLRRRPLGNPPRGVLLHHGPGPDPSGHLGTYGGRWNIETTFQECRSALGLETTRGWCKNTVRRAAPCLFGLYSVVAALFTRVPESYRVRVADWPGKVGVTFSDALASVRRWFGVEGVFPQAAIGAEVQKLSPDLRDFLLAAMTPAT